MSKMLSRQYFAGAAAQANERGMPEDTRVRLDKKVREAHRKLFYEDDGITLKPEALVCLDDWGVTAKCAVSISHYPTDHVRSLLGRQELYHHIVSRMSNNPLEIRHIGDKLEGKE